MLLDSGHNYIRGVILKWRRPYHCIRYWLQKKEDETRTEIINEAFQNVQTKTNHAHTQADSDDPRKN